MKAIIVPPSQEVVDYFNALQLGKAAVFCKRCGRPLTDPNSVALEIGPECYEKMMEAGEEF